MKRQTWQAASFGEGDHVVKRIQFIVIIILLVALIASLVMLIPRLGVRGSMQRNYLSIMLDQSNSAVTESKSLSRFGGTGSITPLSKIRSNVSVIKSMNTLYRDSGGDGALPDSVFDGIISQVDTFIDLMKTNVNSTGNLQTSLQDDLTSLQEQINAMVER